MNGISFYQSSVFIPKLQTIAKWNIRVIVNNFIFQWHPCSLRSRQQTQSKKKCIISKQYKKTITITRVDVLSLKFNFINNIQSGSKVIKTARFIVCIICLNLMSRHYWCVKNLSKIYPGFDELIYNLIFNNTLIRKAIAIFE